MEENNLFYYYLQDEMGSPLRVSRKEGEKAYLTYGYDEFGNDLGKELEQAGIPNPYSRQGEGQPFGYTGYRHDSISDTYFAQAREYNPKTGRFTAEDVIKGNGLMPQTLNPYIYCLNNPLIFSDPSGLTSEKEAQEIIRDNAQYILEAADRFEIDSNLLAGCIYIEQVKNVNFKDEFDTILVWGYGI